MRITCMAKISPLWVGRTKGWRDGLVMESQFSEFVEKLKTDVHLRQKVLFAEHAVARDMDTLSRIAADEGFDISEITRPPQGQPTPTDSEMDAMSATCCWVFTSVCTV
ncbi:hypothetical protein [Streptomyces sp. NPDC058613]|uniref:hypothetical protein n=1 Tax=Streptomyces sp. NPDC058613 TaxID=3346556 RepID=UPI003648B333